MLRSSSPRRTGSCARLRTQTAAAAANTCILGVVAVFDPPAIERAILQPLLAPAADDIVHPDHSRTLSAKRIVNSGTSHQPQLPAHHPSVGVIPFIVAHRAPLPAVQNLHAATPRSVHVAQSDRLPDGCCSGRCCFHRRCSLRRCCFHRRCSLRRNDSCGCWSGGCRDNRDGALWFTVTSAALWLAVASARDAAGAVGVGREVRSGCKTSQVSVSRVAFRKRSGDK